MTTISGIMIKLENGFNSAPRELHTSHVATSNRNACLQGVGFDEGPYDSYTSSSLDANYRN